MTLFALESASERGHRGAMSVESCVCRRLERCLLLTSGRHHSFALLERSLAEMEAVMRLHHVL
jgi:hypothetical protein